MSAPTQATIAKELGISRATVAEILGGRNAHRYNEETRRRVVEVATARGYRPNRNARLLTGVRSGVVGIIKSISTHQRNAEVVLHAAEAIGEQGYEVMSGDIYWHGDGLERAVSSLLDSRTEGVVLAHLAPAILRHPAIRRLVKAGIPMVAPAGDPVEGIPYITSDYFQAAELVVKHFAECGYDRVAMLARRNWESEGTRGYPGDCAARGFLQTAKQMGYPDDKVDVLTLETSGGESRPYPDAMGFVEEIRRRKGRASCGMVFHTDHQAMVAIQMCHRMGLNIPKEVGIVSFDGGSIGGYTWPPLTVIKHPTREVARRAVDILFQKMRGEALESNLFTHLCELIVRDSTGPVAG